MNSTGAYLTFSTKFLPNNNITTSSASDDDEEEYGGVVVPPEQHEFVEFLRQ